MVEYETTIKGTWAEGNVIIRVGESIRFVGNVTGVSLENIELLFYADEHGSYSYAKGQVDEYADEQIQALIVKHVEQTLMNKGFNIDPVVASDDHEP